MVFGFNAILAALCLMALGVGLLVGMLIFYLFGWWGIACAVLALLGWLLS